MTGLRPPRFLERYQFAGHIASDAPGKVKIAHVASRMHLAPVFTRKLALMPFDLANPVWIHDDDIDQIGSDDAIHHRQRRPVHAEFSSRPAAGSAR